MIDVPMGFTVVPLQRLELTQGLSMPFGTEFVFSQTPEWVKNDPLIRNLGRSDWEAIQSSNYCFLAEYDAHSIGEPDPNWKGSEPRTIQFDKSEAGAMANFALWLVQPCAICYTSVLHGLRHDMPGSVKPVPMLQQLETHIPLHCHPNDLEKQPSAEQIRQAGELCDILRSISRGNAVWVAIRSIWAGLVMPHRDIRYSLYWIGLEALFGPENGGSEITYKLSQRIAFLISDNPSSARLKFQVARDCYQTRSQIVHGRWMDDPKMNSRMAATEEIVRESLLRILGVPELRQIFTSSSKSKARDRFLEDMVFAKCGPFSLLSDRGLVTTESPAENSRN